MTRVLIATPCYKQAHFLTEAIESVAAQTHRDLECVIVDDGSPDDTAAVAESLIARYPDLDLRLIRQENRGLAEARNAAIRASDAPYFLPLDSDDRLAPTAIEKMVAALESDPKPSVVSPSGRRFGRRTERIEPYERDLRWLLKRNTYIGTSLVARAAWEQAGGYKSNMAGGYEDWELWISIVANGGVVKILEEELFYYRQSGPSMIDAAVARDLWLRAQIVLNHPELFEPGRVRLARRTRRAADPERPGLLTRLGWLYYFVRDRNRTAFKQQLAALVGRSLAESP
jgi:glycosyltransferase involved in cell wall biosynthesis